jgi:uncharacterized protein (DUF1330 family)
MKKGYWIAHIDVTDEENYPQYMAAAQSIFAKFGARYIVRGGKHKSPETPGRARHVVIEFDTYQKALDCYNSPEYQEAAKLRRQFSDSDIIFVEGN